MTRKQNNVIRQLRCGEPLPPGPPRRYTATGTGYVRLRWRVGKYSYVEVYEHRVLDGYVTDAEHVHHINRKRDDNRPENLEHLDAHEHHERHGSLFIDQCAELYAQGHSTPVIGQAVGINHGTVYRLLQSRGLIEPRSSTTYATPVPPDEVLRSWHAAGVRVGAMSQRSGVGRKRIERRLDEIGLPRFGPGRPPVPSHTDPATVPVTRFDGAVILLTEEKAA